VEKRFSRKKVNGRKLKGGGGFPKGKDPVLLFRQWVQIRTREKKKSSSTSSLVLEGVRVPKNEGGGLLLRGFLPLGGFVEKKNKRRVADAHPWEGEKPDRKRFERFRT